MDLINSALDRLAVYRPAGAAPEAQQRKDAVQSQDRPRAMPSAGPPAEWDAVLEFWFGGDLKKNYSTKWFATGTAQADADEAIISQFGLTLQQAEQGELEHWKSDTAGCIALIVVLDQFSRHAYRNLPRENIDRDDLAALAVAVEFLEGNDGSELPLPWHVFSLMPLRHQPTEDRLNLVLDKMAQRQLQQDAQDDLMRRFVSQTTRRLLDLQGALLRSWIRCAKL